MVRVVHHGRAVDELVGLRWGDVDLLERVLYVRRSIGVYDDPDEATTKTEAGRGS